jgi:sulfonate transport system ATP-binding protein
VIDIHKSFGSNHVLNGVNLDIQSGEFISIVGRSGCGKSTLLRLLAGLEKPTSGRIVINGKDLAGLNRNARVMFQDARLMPWMKVLDNVGLGLDGDWKPRAEAALVDVGLDSRAKDWPAILSGGQRQRVSLARALVNEPQFMLLDEPHGALDALTKLDMQNLLERLWLKRRFSALLITHDVEEAIILSDRTILIQDGRIVMDVRIDLARPRNKASARFVELRQDLLHCVTGGVLGPGAEI